MESSARGATVGKLALGLRVVRDDGARLSFLRATGRHFPKIIITPLIPLAIGYLMAAFTDRKRALHDIIADTLVISRAEFTGDRHASVRTPVPPRRHRLGCAAGRPTSRLWRLLARVLAYIIDGILLRLAKASCPTGGIDASIRLGTTIRGNLVSLVIGWLYFALLESSERGATVGKMAVACGS